MTDDPFQIVMMILLIAGLPFIVWLPRRITELMAVGEEARVPEFLRLLANQKYLASIYEGEIEYRPSHRWKFFVVVIGLILPSGMLCSAKTESIVPRLLVVLTSVIVFIIGIALLEWSVRRK